MAKNLMCKICKMLGVELGEELVVSEDIVLRETPLKKL